ncbi:GNAT family N-acetyltransferase [uncultured Brachybacterium sp.]|uniref:GNAT family N-acetyltransferase n=1 Tax=uncultured Brachybacterium sp. TaxID=189680 RepID=UPI002633BDCD|nr:GNAT family N-acetyltransferase [uncultured Brachybacterium sp.]
MTTSAPAPSSAPTLEDALATLDALPVPRGLPAWTPAAEVPLDQVSEGALRSGGLEYCTIDGHDESAFESFVAAVSRGFLEERTEHSVGWRSTLLQVEGRLVGVFDPSAPHAETPVGTIATWGTGLVLDPGCVVPMWAISDVTVSSTHRRRGIARAMLEGELRTAAGAGYSIAGLTVSEATIYGRYGFGPAVGARAFTIENRRAGWSGPRPVDEGRGRIDPIEREDAMRALASIHAETVVGRPGEISGWAGLWRDAAGLHPQKENKASRAVQYTDSEGSVRGIIVYSVKEADGTATLRIERLIAATTDAYAALWRFALTHDLITTVTGGLRSSDEPVRWMLEDQRALKSTEHDHHWLRVLDVAACLEGRRYRIPGSVVLEVIDPLGITGGRYRLTVDGEGAGAVETLVPGRVGASGAADGSAVDAATARVGVSELSSLLLGGARWGTLAAAGRIEADAAATAWLDVAFAPSAPLQLSVGY